MYIVIDVNFAPEHNIDTISFGNILKYIMAEYGIKISNSNITSVLQKSGVSKLEAGAITKTPAVQTLKEKAVIDAFKVYGVIVTPMACKK